MRSSIKKLQQKLILRIIAGKYKSRRVNSLHESALNHGYRPTANRAKESLFNVLNNLIDFEGITCLDLFAGSGSLGFEALSRGAESCDFVESFSGNIKLIEQTAKELGVENLIKTYRNDVISFLENKSIERPAGYNLIFADPPYQYDEYDILLSKIFKTNFDLFVLEHFSEKKLEYNNDQFDVISKKVGTIKFEIFSNKE